MKEETLKEIQTKQRELALLQNELENSPSDRACVVVAAAYLDDELRYLLDFFLTEPANKEESKELYSNMGPLSTFNNKINLSFRLGLISRYEYSAFQVIRKIRNIYAHKIDPDGLKAYHQELLKIMPPRKLLPVKTIPLPPPDGSGESPVFPRIDESSPRDIFVKTVLCIQNLLAARILSAVKQKRKIPCDYGSLLDVEEERVAASEELLRSQSESIDNLIKSIDEIDTKMESLSALCKGNHAEEIKEIEERVLELKKEVIDADAEESEQKKFLQIQKYVRDKIKEAIEKL